MKKGAMIVLVIILLAGFVYAAPNAVLNLKPVYVYETNTALFNLTANNLFGNEVIDQLDISLPGFTITDAVSFFGWENNFSGSEIRWYNGDIETNAYNLFQFNAKAGLVDANTTINAAVTTKGESSEQTTDNFEIIIVNDISKPVLSANTPADGGLLKEGITDQLVSVNAADAETGILNASFSYNDCNPNSTATTVLLNGSGDVYTANLDFSAFKEGESMCFEFLAYNNALETASISGTVEFDGTPPVVELLSPDNNAYKNINTEFSFEASDNMADTLACNLFVDGISVNSTAIANGEPVSLSHDLSGYAEGTHEWKANCIDSVGWDADSETRNVIVDRTPPAITLVSPANNSMIGDNIIIDIDVTDNYEVDSVDYSISLNSTELPEGTNNLIVAAADKAGNTAVSEFVFIVDRTSPTINLIAPDDNARTESHVSFAFDINDNLDAALDCSLYANDAVTETKQFNLSNGINWPVIMPMAIYEWHIKCNDDAGNSVDSEKRNLNVTDLTGPDTVLDIVYVARSENYPFTAVISDPSGVRSASASLEGADINLLNIGSNYNGVISTDTTYILRDYNLTINSEDMYGNPSAYTDTFTLVQGYAITLALSSSTANPGDAITASGTVELDDGAEAPENYLTLYLPSETVNVTITNRSYSYTFNAPSAGGYTIIASVVSSEGFDHRKTAELTVENPAPSPSSGGGGGSSSKNTGQPAQPYAGGIRQYCGDGLCTHAINENCGNCAVDCGKCPVKEAPSKDAAKGTQIVEETTTEEEPRTPAGVGAGTSLFGRIIANPYSWLILAMIIAALLFISRKGRDKDNLNWDGYFERRN